MWNRLSPCSPHSLDTEQNERQRWNGLYIDFSGNKLPVYTYVNLYDIFIFKFTYMQIDMKDLL